MTVEELSDHTHNGQMNRALHSVAALFEQDGWGPCDSIKAANELMKPAWDAWSTLMERVTKDTARITELQAALAEAREDSARLDWLDAQGRVAPAGSGLDDDLEEGTSWYLLSEYTMLRHAIDTARGRP
jgi:hypothetical protein